MQEPASIFKYLLAAPFLAMALACGGGSAGTVLVDPDPAVVVVGETLTLTARPQPDSGAELDWEVQEMYGGGLLRSQGAVVTYVAPEAAGTYHLVMRGTGRDGKVHKQTIEVLVLPSPSVEPAAPRLRPGGGVSFKARMRGLSRDTAVWAVEEADGGDVTPDGRYTAPKKPGIYHLTATSTVDASAVARVTVTVTAGDN